MTLLPVLAVMLASPPTIKVPPPTDVVEIPPVRRTTGVRPVAPTPSEALARGMVRLTPVEAIVKAAANKAGVVGVFEAHILIANPVGERLFLGTERDYRDPRNLAIAIEPAAIRGLIAREGAPLERVFKGHHIRVVGRARQVRIAYLDSAGRRTGSYYFQTHVAVTNANQVEIVD